MSTKGHDFRNDSGCGDRLRALREEKQLSQGDVEKRSGLLRCYISRVENGHTVPAIDTLEKMARALEIPMYQLFYEGEEPPKLPNLFKRDRLTKSHGVTQAKMRGFWANFAVRWARPTNKIAGLFCLWPRNWLVASLENAVGSASSVSSSLFLEVGTILLVEALNLASPVFRAPFVPASPLEMASQGASRGGI